MSVPTRVGALTHFTLGAALLFDHDTSLGINYTKSIGNDYDVDTVSARFSSGL